jgi:hypothetical protein
VKKLSELDAKTVRLGVAGLIAVVVVVVLAVGFFGGDESSDKESSGNAVSLSESELQAEASNLGHAVYWVGARPDTESYELTSTPDGRVYIRYLTGGAKAGDPHPNFLTVGTYRVPEADQALRTAKEAGQGTTLSKHEGYEVLGSESGSSAYVVFEAEPELQIEIFSPNPGEATELANSGALAPLG